jgi:phage terminase large subunit GpA-like protein
MAEKCPKCGGESYLSQEDLAGIAEKAEPPKAVIKQTLICKACGEKFSRIVFESLDTKKKTEAKKQQDIFEGFHKPGIGLEEPQNIEVF